MCSSQAGVKFCFQLFYSVEQHRKNTIYKTIPMFRERGASRVESMRNAKHFVSFLDTYLNSCPESTRNQFQNLIATIKEGTGVQAPTLTACVASLEALSTFMEIAPGGFQEIVSAATNSGTLSGSKRLTLGELTANDEARMSMYLRAFIDQVNQTANQCMRQADPTQISEVSNALRELSTTVMSKVKPLADSMRAAREKIFGRAGE